MRFAVFLSTAGTLLVHGSSSHSAENRNVGSKGLSRYPLAFGLGRREALQKAGSVLAGGVSLLRNPLPSLADEIQEQVSTATEEQVSSTTIPNQSFSAYSITPDASEYLTPTLRSIDQDVLYAALGSSSKGGAVWLGEHHNSEKDHMIQADVIRKLHAARPDDAPMAIGLEQVQVQFQSILDEFVNEDVSLDQLKELVQWKSRWTWPFDGYREIFETARDLKIPLIALNVDSEDLALVERAGLPGLDSSQLQKYITDPYGFADFAKPVQFRTYVDYVIRPSYDMHRAMGLLRHKHSISGQILEEEMSFRNFLSGRILWDEAMASKANKWTAANPGGLLIGLVGADHVKFLNGIPGRYARMAGDSRDCVSVMLNPTLIDTAPSGSVSGIASAYSSENPDQINLQLRYLKDGVDSMSPDRVLPSNTGGVLPLADYIVVN